MAFNHRFGGLEPHEYARRQREIEQQLSDLALANPLLALEERERRANMDRGDGIIRWSPNTSRDEFLTINVSYRILQLYKATGSAIPSQFDYEEVSKHTDFQAFGAYDWSPVVPGLVAIGTKSGEVHLLRIDDSSSDSIVLPLKLQRTCQAVAFNSTGLLAVGLDRVRNDQCLQIWDINQRLSNWDATKKGWQTPAAGAEPLHRLEPTLPITSTRFFEDQPQTLVIGVKNQSVKIHDLRDPSGAVISFQTRCNNNLAIDHRDTNYFASSSLDQPGVMVWDRRATSRHVASKMYTDSVDSGDLPWGCVLKLNRVIDPNYDSHIRSLRFCRDQRGLLGVLSSSGELQLLSLKREYVEPSPENGIKGTPELLEVKKSHDIQYPFFHENFGYSHDDRIVSFDWMTLGSSLPRPRIITRRSNHQIGIKVLPSEAQNYHLDLLDFSSRAKHFERGDLPKFSDPKQAQSVLEPLEQSLLNIDVKFGSLSEKSNVSVSNVAQPDMATSASDLQTTFIPAIPSQDQANTSDERMKSELAEGLKQLSLGKVLSSREKHDKFLMDSFEVSAEQDLFSLMNSIMLSRIRKGYLFNCTNNRAIVRNDPWLQSVWKWIELAELSAKGDGMVSDQLIFNYMGVQTLWNNDLGAKFESRLIDTTTLSTEDEFANALEDINKRAGRGPFNSIPTKKPHHRQACLAMCGWGKSDAELESDLLALEARDQYTKAAAWALFEKNPQRAVEALRHGGKSLLFIALALSLQVKGGHPLDKEDWSYNVADLSDMADDPYLRAIYAYISTNDWKAIVNEASLPLRDRVGVALHNFDDAELTTWLDERVVEAIQTGDVEGIVLTGITDRMVDILSKYIEKFGDYQTASLVIHFAAPLYIKDFRVSQWRAEYQDLHNKNSLFIERTKYDVQSTKKSRDRDGFSAIKPRPRQVTLRCTHCDTAYTNDLDNTAMPSSSNASKPPQAGISASQNPLYPSGVNAGIACPTCGRHLPRCGICLMTLGMPRSDKDKVAAEPYNRLANFMTFCMKCDHAFHADHARQWFQIHNECPIPDCHCACNRDAGGMRGMMGTAGGEPARQTDGEHEAAGAGVHDGKGAE